MWHSAKQITEVPPALCPSSLLSSLNFVPLYCSLRGKSSLLSDDSYSSCKIPPSSSAGNLPRFLPSWVRSRSLTSLSSWVYSCYRTFIGATVFEYDVIVNHILNPTSSSLSLFLHLCILRVKAHSWLSEYLLNKWLSEPVILYFRLTQST